MQANEGEGSLTWNMFSHVFEFVQNGNRAFRDNNFEEVKCFASCSLSSLTIGESIILFFRLCIKLSTSTYEFVYIARSVFYSQYLKIKFKFIFCSGNQVLLKSK